MSVSDSECHVHSSQCVARTITGGEGGGGVQRQPTDNGGDAGNVDSSTNLLHLLYREKRRVRELEHLIDNLKWEFVCPVCMEPRIDVIILPCEHAVCSTCYISQITVLGAVKLCEIRANHLRSMSDISPHLLLDIKIDHMKCSVCRHTFDWIHTLLPLEPANLMPKRAQIYQHYYGPRSLVDQHPLQVKVHHNYEMVSLRCPNIGCNKLLTNLTFQSHVHDCHMFQWKCPLRGCGGLMQVAYTNCAKNHSEIRMHYLHAFHVHVMRDCQYKVSCTMNGCKEQYLLRHEHLHLQSAHVPALQQRVSRIYHMLPSLNSMQLDAVHNRISHLANFVLPSTLPFIPIPVPRPDQIVPATTTLNNSVTDLAPMVPSTTTTLDLRRNGDTHATTTGGGDDDGTTTTVITGGRSNTAAPEHVGVTYLDLEELMRIDESSGGGDDDEEEEDDDDDDDSVISI